MWHRGSELQLLKNKKCLEKPESGPKTRHACGRAAGLLGCRAIGLSDITTFTCGRVNL